MTSPNNSPSSSPTSYVLPDLPYELNALEPVVSARIMELHHGTHHASYVKNANELTEKLHALPAGEDPTPLLRARSFHVSGHVLHSLFWNCMTPNGSGKPTGALAEQIDASFGSLDVLTGRMSAAVEKLAGSGWGALVWEPTGERLVVTQIHDHQNEHIAGDIPLLVIDGWEHAYYLQYEAGKAKWVKAFWDICNWDGVARRLDEARAHTAVGARSM